MHPHESRRSCSIGGARALPLAAVLATSVTGMAAPPTTQPAPSGWVTYRLMTYNVASAANLPLGPRQIGQIADVIVDNAVDIAGLTEVELGTAWHGGRDHVAEIAVALAARGYPMHLYKWPSFAVQGGWQTPALLSRWPIEECGYQAVPPPGGFRWCVGHITVYVAQNTPIRAYMTHFWPQGDPGVCAAAVRKLVSLPHVFDGPCTIMGDFNLTPASPLYKIVRSEGWTNSCEAVHGAPCPSVQGQAGVSGPLPLNAQIDYIFGNDQIEFVDSYVGYFSMSDHWPVFAVVRVKANGPPIARPPRYVGQRRSAQAAARASAAALYRAHKYKAAAQAYRRWEKLCSDRDDAGFAAYSAASMYLLADDRQAALDGFARVIRQYPETEWSARAHYRRAFLLREAQRWRAAEQEFLAFLEGYYTRIHPCIPKSPAVWITASEIATCRRSAGRKTTAGQVLEELAARDPDSPVARAAAYRLARQAYQAGRRQQAVAYFKQADPSPKGLWPDEAKICAELALLAGEPERADAFWQALLEHFSDPLLRRVRAARWRKRRFPEQFRLAVPRSGPVTIDADLSDWRTKPAVILQGPEHVFRYDPDAPADELAATLNLACTDQALLIGLDVSDSQHTCPYRDGQIFRGDSVQIAIDPACDATKGYNEDDFEIGVALTDEGVQTWVWVDRLGRDWTRLAAAVRRADGHTCYEIAVPLSVLQVKGQVPRRIGFDVLVNDADGAGRLGWIDWTPGIGEEKSPALYPTLLLP